MQMREKDCQNCITLQRDCLALIVNFIFSWLTQMLSGIPVGSGEHIKHQNPLI